LHQRARGGTSRVRPSPPSPPQHARRLDAGRGTRDAEVTKALAVVVDALEHLRCVARALRSAGWLGGWVAEVGPAHRERHPLSLSLYLSVTL